MNKKAVDEYRDGVSSRLEELAIMYASQKSDMAHIKETVDEIKDLLKEQNSRIRTNEKAISGIRAIGSMIGLIFASIIGILFKKSV
jgi:tetrahydromethanopterin S-methyltransferase subunit F|tara:strand:+ start:1497 stop:1754 length:258 start_codon:yes stop_codon:yes gene_type:complete